MTAETARPDTHYPHLPRAWRERVVIDLRRRGASGPAIGDALATADAHCADSGRPPAEALGPPERYASQVVLPAEDTPDRVRDAVGSVLTSLVGLVGLFLAVAAADAWSTGDEAALTWGAVMAVGVIAATSLLVLRRPDLLLRRTWVGTGVLLATLLVVVGLMTTLTRPVLVAPPPVVLAAAVCALLAELLWSARHVDVDPVRDPLRGDPSPRATRLVARLRPWFATGATVVAVALTLALSG